MYKSYICCVTFSYNILRNDSIVIVLFVSLNASLIVANKQSPEPSLSRKK